MTTHETREFAYALHLAGEETVRRLFEAGRYRAKKYDGKREVIRLWLASQKWRAKARLN